MDTRACRLALLFLAALLVTAGCNDDDTPADDDDYTTEEPEPPCEEGYVLDRDLPDEFLDDFPDGCVPAACGAGRWGNLEVDEDTVYVDAGAGDGGDGSEDAPFNSIQVGLDAAGDSGLMVAVAAGTYFENLLLTEDNEDAGNVEYDFTATHCTVDVTGNDLWWMP